MRSTSLITIKYHEIILSKPFDNSMNRDNTSLYVYDDEIYYNKISSYPYVGVKKRCLIPSTPYDRAKQRCLRPSTPYDGAIQRCLTPSTAYDVA